MKIQIINKEYIVNDYNIYKEKAFQYYRKNNITKCMKCISYCGIIAWRYPIKYDFCDDELEELIKTLGKKINSASLNTNKNTNKIVFYNTQIIDSGALTEQYLNFFVSNKYEILFIIPNKHNTILGKGILKIISDNPHIKLFIPKGKSTTKKIINIYKEIINFSPDKAFLHLIPNDIIGCILFSNLEHIKKYYIVHNDHTFWFGKNSSDFFIEFRKFGYLLSIQRRNINSSNLYHVPYYPIIQKKEFIGFPFNPKDKIIGFSGAALYKYFLDPELKYFHAIKKLIEINENFVFCLAGNGNFKIVYDFIEKNNLQNRFFVLGKRNDFYELVKHIDIYFESYPLKGGLSVLYAIENHKPIIGIGENNNASGCIEDWFDLKNYHQPQNFTDFINEANDLINNCESRKNNIKLFEKNLFKKDIFEKKLKRIMEGELPPDKPIYNEPLQLNDNYYLEEYIKIPDTDFEYFNLKLFSLKECIPFWARFKIFFLLLKLKPLKNIKCLFRYIIIIFLAR